MLGAIAGCTNLRIGCGDVAGCRCWVPLLGCHCWAPFLGMGGGAGDTLACGAIAGCRCWAPLLGIGGGGCTSSRIGCGDVAGWCCWVPLLGAIAGDRGVGVHIGGLDVVPLPLLGAIAGLPLLGAIAGWHCRCWLPLLGGMWSGAMVRCHWWVPCGKVIAGCHGKVRW